MLRAISILSLVLLLFPIGLYLTSFESEAEEGTITLVDTETRAVNMGSYKPGDLIEFGWNCVDNNDRLDSFITNGTHNFGEVTNVYGFKGSLNVEDEEEFVMLFMSNYENHSVPVEFYFYRVRLGVTYGFSTQEARKGQDIQIKIDITNSNEKPIEITALGVHFDWMVDDAYQVDENLEANPQYMSPGASAKINIDFTVPEDAEPGLHLYNILLEYTLEFRGNWTTYTWATGNRYDFWVEDEDTDGDGISDLADPFPNDASEWADADGDGYGDNTDRFPLDPGEWADNNSNGIGDHEDERALQELLNKDTDGDGVSDGEDAFRTDPAASVDSDEDGHPDQWNTGKSGRDSPSGLTLDHFPDDPERWEKEEKADYTLFIILGIAGAFCAATAIGLYLYSKKSKKDTEKDD